MIAVVTGAARGIGRAIAYQLVQDGLEVVVTDLDADAAHATAKAIGCEAVQVDVSDTASVDAFVNGLSGGVKVLVNNAGVWRYGALADVNIEDARQVLNVNVIGALTCTQRIISRMTPGSSIVNVASTTAYMPPPGVGVYPASKGAIVSLTRSLAVELGPLGIRVNAVAPGLIRTEGTEHGYADGHRQTLGKALPLGRHGEPKDVADVASFLASDRSQYVTGQVICVDGGLTLTGIGALQ